MYTEHKPHILLAPYVETYWTASEYVPEEVQLKILPDGCVDILFNFGDSKPEDELQPFIPHIIGAMTRHAEVTYIGRVQMVGIRFAPSGISAFTRTPINEFTDLRVDMSLVKTIFDERFHDTLPSKKTLSEKLRHIDSYLVGKLHSAFALDRQISRAVDLIRHSHGQMKLSRLAENVCLCPRQLERKFKASIGVSPKTFGKIIKFKHTLSYLRSQPKQSLYVTAVDCGYHDHAHLIKDFKNLAGESPLRYRGKKA